MHKPFPSSLNTPLSPLQNTTPLLRAVHHGHVATAKRLIELNANVKQTLEHGETVLHMAAARLDTDMVKMLCESGADPNAEDQVRV